MHATPLDFDLKIWRDRKSWIDRIAVEGENT
jgi:hypothetical protein